MRLKVLCILAVLLCSASAALGAVRIRIKDGKRIIYNDGVGPSSREVLGKSDSWLAARIATPSLYDGLIADAARENSLDPKLVKSVVLIDTACTTFSIRRRTSPEALGISHTCWRPTPETSLGRSRPTTRARRPWPAMAACRRSTRRASTSSRGWPPTTASLRSAEASASPRERRGEA